MLISLYSLPKARFIVQDLEEMMDLAKANVQLRAFEAVNAGRITVEPHNFFAAQPRYGEHHVYLLRHIL